MGVSSENFYCIFLSLSIHASEWDFHFGDLGQLERVLQDNIGESKVYNCDITIEKLETENVNFYFVTVYDRFMEKYAVMNLVY